MTAIHPRGHLRTFQLDVSRPRRARIGENIHLSRAESRTRSHARRLSGEAYVFSTRFSFRFRGAKIFFRASGGARRCRVVRARPRDLYRETISPSFNFLSSTISTRLFCGETGSVKLNYRREGHFCVTRRIIRLARASSLVISRMPFITRTSSFFPKVEAAL